MEKIVKKCKKCNISKELVCFYGQVQKSGNFTYFGKCKDCTNQELRERQSLRHEKYRLKKKEWYLNNRDLNVQKMKQWKEINKIYNLEYQRDYQKQYLRNNIQHKIAQNLRSRIRSAVKGLKTGSSIENLGCSVENLILWLESQFKDGMNWGNYGKWHIDHIKPLSLFDLTKELEFKKACHYSNLQPLWAVDNLKKGNRK